MLGRLPGLLGTFTRPGCRQLGALLFLGLELRFLAALRRHHGPDLFTAILVAQRRSALVLARAGRPRHAGGAHAAIGAGALGFALARQQLVSASAAAIDKRAPRRAQLPA